MDCSLTNRIAVITGASRGIGLATAHAFYQHGASLVLAGRSIESLKSGFATGMPGYDEQRVQFFECDVSIQSDVQRLFQTGFATFKRLDIAVANAGVMDSSLVGMTSQASIEHTFAVNTLGTFYTNQLASRLMSRTGGGSIVNVSSLLGIQGAVGQSAYSASKAAVIGLTKSLAKELAPANIRVNAVAPGMIDTDLIKGLSESDLQKNQASIAMGRIGTPEEVADVITFLASDMARYVTGQVIGVDGGMLI